MISEIPFSSALIIDNKPEDIEQLRADLKKRNLMVMVAKGSTEAKTIIQQRPELDVIILDWLLNEEDAIEAQELLIFLRKQTFAPVIIYTDKGKDPPRFYLREKKLDRLSIVFNKSEVKGDSLFNEIASWLTNKPELRIFLRWSRQVEHKLNETLWDIYNLNAEGIKAIIRLLYTDDAFSQLSQEEELINFFSRILYRKLGNHEQLLKLVKADIDALSKNKKKAKTTTKQIEKPEIDEKAEYLSEEYKTFHSFERYRPTNSKFLWTGSILRNKNGKYAVVVTPACDFSHAEKIENVLLVKAEPLDEYIKNRPSVSRGSIESCISHNTACVHFLPYAAGLKDGLVCRFDTIFNIKLERLQKDIESNEVTCLMAIDSPFVENLIQRMNGYLMRLGTREIERSQLAKLLASKEEGKTD